jgi:hypothetical protein
MFSNEAAVLDNTVKLITMQHQSFFSIGNGKGIFLINFYILNEMSRAASYDTNKSASHLNDPGPYLDFPNIVQITLL